MKQMLKLSIIYFKEQVSSAFTGLSKRAKAKSVPTMILLFLLLSCAIGYSLYNFAEVLNLVGNSKYILIIGSFMGLFMSLMLTLTDTQGVMYKSRDYELLASLPLKNVTIISSKYLGSYLTTALYYMLVTIPTFVVYFIFNKVTAVAIIFGLISIIFMPAFSQLISSLLGFLVNAITAKMKNKNIIRTIFSLIFAVSLAVFISLSSSDFLSGMFIGGLPLWFKIIFSNIYFLFTAIINSSFVYFVYAILISIAFMVLGVSVILIGFRKINTSLMITKIKGKSAPITYTQKSVFSRLLKKEFSTFFNSPVYCVNGLIGLIMCIVCTIITLTSFSQMQGIDLGIINDIFICIMAFSVSMCLGIAPTTSVSISIEGSKLQNIKSLPIKFKDIAMSKCSLNLILSVPVIFLSVLIYGIVTKISIFTILLVLGYLIIVTICQTVLGLLFNLRFQRLNWTSETQAVKNGASMLLTMFLDMIISIVPMVVFLVWYANVNYLTFNYFMLGLLALQIIYAIVLITLLTKKGEKLFNKIQV